MCGPHFPNGDPVLTFVAAQLVDVVAFLQSAYEIEVDDSMYYPYAY